MLWECRTPRVRIVYMREKSQEGMEGLGGRLRDVMRQVNLVSLLDSQPPFCAVTAPTSSIIVAGSSTCQNTSFPWFNWGIGASKMRLSELLKDPDNRIPRSRQVLWCFHFLVVFFSASHGHDGGLLTCRHSRVRSRGDHGRVSVRALITKLIVVLLVRQVFRCHP